MLLARLHICLAITCQFLIYGLRHELMSVVVDDGGRLPTKVAPALPVFPLRELTELTTNKENNEVVAQPSLLWEKEKCFFMQERDGLHVISLGSQAAAKKRGTIVPFEDKDVKYFKVAKIFGKGLSVDQVCLADLIGYSKQVVLKLFLKLSDAKKEVNAIINMNKLGLGEYFPKHVFSGKISGASSDFLARWKNALVATEFEAVYAVQDFLMELCTNSIDMAVTEATKRIGLQMLELGPLQLVADLVFQIFYIIYIMKTKGTIYNHCDMHMHNVLISLDNPPVDQPIIESGGVFNPSGIRLKVIDLDTMTKVQKQFGRYKLCKTQKAVWSGTRRVLTQSNSLLKICKSKYAVKDPTGIDTKVAKGNPISEQVKATFDPVDGDMYHFRWMLEVLNSKLKLGIDMLSLAKVIDTFSEMKLPHRKKTAQLTSYYKDALMQVYNIVFRENSLLSQYVSSTKTSKAVTHA